MAETSKLVKMFIRNLGCIGPEGCEIALDKIICLVGANNTGKSTVLRAYELVAGTANFDPKVDLCKRAAGGPASVELWVHIPQDIPNIAEKWKAVEGNLRLVRSRWEWSAEANWAKVRSTFDPELGDYSPDANAGGLESVFVSRLPVPFRIGSLEDPETEHKKLLTLILEPISDKIKLQMGDKESKLRKALASIGAIAAEPVEEEKGKLLGMKDNLNKSHNAIFPALKLDFEIGIGEVEIDPLKMLASNSKLKFKDWDDEVLWSQQGTGSQRALFWAMLQVRSQLKTLADLAGANRKEISAIEKEVRKIASDMEKAKKEETKKAKAEEIAKLEAKKAAIAALKPEEQMKAGNELALPGYMLLIDEPETGLHPNAIRAASRYLYGLASDSTWQVMLATHAPAFIDPLQDHTTIVRLHRDGAHPTPRTYRSDAVEFMGDEKEKLKTLNRFDTGIAEMFFGQHPILVEGDTEFGAFEELIYKLPDVFPLSEKPVIVRARGKHTMLLIMRILSAFKISYSVLHDADSPLTRKGKTNGAWTGNAQIATAIAMGRAAGARIVHRVSVPGFEYAHLPVEVDEDGMLVSTPSKDKPWRTVEAMRKNAAVEASILTVLKDLTGNQGQEAPFAGEFNAELQTAVAAWANANCPADARYKFPAEGGVAN